MVPANVRIHCPRGSKYSMFVVTVKYDALTRHTTHDSRLNFRLVVGSDYGFGWPKTYIRVDLTSILEVTVFVAKIL